MRRRLCSSGFSSVRRESTQPAYRCMKAGSEVMTATITETKMIAATTPATSGIQNTTIFPLISSGMLSPSATMNSTRWLIAKMAGAAPTVPENPAKPWRCIASLSTAGLEKIAAYPRPASVPNTARTSKMMVRTTSHVRRFRFGGAYAGAADAVGIADAAYPGIPYGFAGAGAGASAAEAGVTPAPGAYSPYCGTGGSGGAGGSSGRGSEFWSDMSPTLAAASRPPICA
jgi:hypothetical protein